MSDAIWRRLDAGQAPALAAYAYALVTAAVMGHFLLGIPIQVSDSFGNMLSLQTTWTDLVVGQFYQRAYLRPFLWGELKLVFDLARGDYTPWFRGVHVAQVLALVVLFLSYVRVRTWKDCAIVPIAIAALLGIHTFEGAVIEAFPVNTFLTILLCALAAANLTRVAPRWWVDVLAALLFVVSALTVESGLLVWVIIVGAALVGAKGVSRTGLGVLTALLVAYFVLRFAYLDVGSPGLDERSSGFGFRVLETPELVERFGQSPWGFYLYNVVTSFASVLFGEPRAGVFRVVDRLVNGGLSPADVINVVASTLGTVLIGVYVWQRRAAWFAWRFEPGDRVVAVFLIVLAANAVISYPYTKDVIMSPAGVFYAAALFVAARHVLFEWMTRSRRLLPSIAVGLFCLAFGGAWAVRETGMHLNLRITALKTRNDWAYEVDRLAQQGTVLEPAGIALFDQLRRDALFVGTPPPQLSLERWRIFEVD